MHAIQINSKTRNMKNAWMHRDTGTHIRMHKCTYIYGGTQPGRSAGAEEDTVVPPALAPYEPTPHAHTQLRVAITSRTRNTISRSGVTDKPISLPLTSDV